MAYTVYKPMVPVRGVLFDMDGVILDSEKLYTRFWQEAGLALGYPMTREHAMGMRALNRDAAVQKLQSYFGPKVDYPAIKAKRIELMDAYVAEHGMELKPGIREYLVPLGIYDSFTAVCTAYQVAHSKPEPDIYLFGAESVGLPPEQCLALEDSAAGILSGYRAGCMVTMVPDQDAPDPDTLSRISALADSLLDVIDLIQSVN